MEVYKQNILIIGGGYGGLKVALGIQRQLKSKAKITLISKHDYHYQTTLLHKVAVGTLSPRKAESTIVKSSIPIKSASLKTRLSSSALKKTRL